MLKPGTQRLLEWSVSRLFRRMGSHPADQVLRAMAAKRKLVLRDQLRAARGTPEHKNWWHNEPIQRVFTTQPTEN